MAKNTDTPTTWKTKDDDRLIVASKDGNDAAFGELVRRYQEIGRAHV